MIILTIFIQIYFATIDAENLVDSEIIAPTQTKIKIIEDSMLWEKADFSKNPFKKIVDDYVKEHLPKEEEKKQKKRKKRRKRKNTLFFRSPLQKRKEKEKEGREKKEKWKKICAFTRSRKEKDPVHPEMNKV